MTIPSRPADARPDRSVAVGNPDLERIGRRDDGRGVTVMVVTIAAWIVLAAWTPTSTYHFAPLVAAGVWSFLLRRGPLRVALVDVAVAAGAAATVVTVVGLGLHLADLLRGPTLWGSGPAIAEVPLAAVTGSVIGARIARCGVPAEPHAD